MNKIKLAKLITTFFYIGNIKYCPGTFGSIAAYIFSTGLMYVIGALLFYTTAPSDVAIMNFFIFGVPIILGVTFVVLFIAGVYFSTIYINQVGREDPKEIVIDEVAGQLLTMILCMPSAIMLFFLFNGSVKQIFLIWYLPSFVLFRLFDILKPWPINVIDRKVKKGLGVMLDDVVAAIFASVTTYVVIFLLI
jgi:phosphatidylglycerophosphatase A